jgi:hypothetical protein
MGRARDSELTKWFVGVLKWLLTGVSGPITVSFSQKWEESAKIEVSLKLNRAGRRVYKLTNSPLPPNFNSLSSLA